MLNYLIKNNLIRYHNIKAINFLRKQYKENLNKEYLFTFDKIADHKVIVDTLDNMGSYKLSIYMLMIEKPYIEFYKIFKNHDLLIKELQYGLNRLSHYYKFYGIQ